MWAMDNADENASHHPLLHFARLRLVLHKHAVGVHLLDK
jgi:hypothetical protein